MTTPSFSVKSTDTLTVAADAFIEWLAARARAGLTSASNLRQKKLGLRALALEIGEEPNTWRIGDIQLRDLLRSQVVEWVDRLAVTPPRSREFVALRSLQALIKWAANRDAVSVAVVSRINHSYRSAPGRSLTWDQLQTLRAALRERDVTGPARAVIRYLRIVANDGPRAYEIREARAAQVDRAQRCLRWVRGKSGKPRVVVLSEVSLLLIELQIRENEDNDGHLFPSPIKAGAAWTGQAMGRHLKQICREAGLPHTSLKDLRTTFATLAHENGASIDDVADALGHSSTETTRRFYLANVVRPGARRANAAVNEPREVRHA